MTRYRVMESPNPAGYFQITGRTNYYATQSLGPALKRICYDEVVPNFKLRSKRGEIFNNPFSSTKIECQYRGGYFGTETRPGEAPKIYSHVTAALPSRWSEGLFSLPTLNVDNARAKCRVDALAAINATEFDVSTFLAEWSKTRALFKNVVDSVKNSLLQAHGRYRPSSVKRIPVFDHNGNPLLNRNGKPIYKYSTTPAKFSGSALGGNITNGANLWLIVRFGIRPLLAELESALKLLSSSRSLRYTARSTQFVTDNSSSTITAPDDWGKVWVINVNATRVVTLRNGILYESSDAGRMLAQLGLTRLGSTAWELVPLSFVFDWLFQVGNWLDAIQPSGASKSLCAWESTHEVRADTLSISDSFSGSTQSYNASITWNESASRVITTNVRNPWSQSIPPRPNSGSGIHDLRLVDFAALVLQKIHFR